MREEVVVSGEALKKAEEYIEIEEGVVNKLPGVLGSFITALAVIMSLFHLYAAYGIMPTHILRASTLHSFCSCASCCSRSANASATASAGGTG